MTKNQADVIFRVLIYHKVYGYPNQVQSLSMESDGRKQNKTMRDLVEAGYLSQTGEKFTATNKLWNETVTESVDLIAIWENSRTSGWNRHKKLPLVRFDILTDGQKKTVVECAGHYQWFVCNNAPLNYNSPIQDNDMYGPIENPDTNLGTKLFNLCDHALETLRSQKQARYPTVEVVLKIDGLTTYVERVLAEEKFDVFYRQNLKWGLTALEVASSEDAKEIITADEPNWLFGSANNLGTDPATWGEKLNERIKNAYDGIVRIQSQLAIMERIAFGIEAMGGWEVFREKYREKLTEELAKKSD